jgi:hypothetical protein
MSETPAHDWLRPKLADLVEQAERAGFDSATIVAVITDLITSPPYDEVLTPDN